jgi:hypothetical protein
MMSGKGLLMDTTTREAFEAGMSRVIAAILHQPPMSNRPSDSSLEDAAEVYPTSIAHHGQTRRRSGMSK